MIRYGYAVSLHSMKPLIILLLTASATAQSVVLAPPDQREYHSERVGTVAITYVQPLPENKAVPTLIVDTPGNPLYCYASEDTQGTIHSHCEGPRDPAEHTQEVLYLRNYRCEGLRRPCSDTGEYSAILDSGSKCDPIRAAIADAVAKRLQSVTFAFTESRLGISVACSFTDVKGQTKQGTAKYNVYPSRH